MSPADLMDPYVFLQIDPSLTFDRAAALYPKHRADLLANRPLEASTIFHRRVSSLFENFLFDETRHFGELAAYMGRVEQQSRLSPHIHILLWTEFKPPPEMVNSSSLQEARANCIELFHTAIIPPDSWSHFGRLPKPNDLDKMQTMEQIRKKGSICSPAKQLRFTGVDSHRWIFKPFVCHLFDGSQDHNEILRGLTVATQLHKCQSYCLRQSNTCRFKLRNSTHPLLTAMFRYNTDVTVVTGSSIVESAYVCSYAVKADKQPMIDYRALKKIKEYHANDEEDRTLLRRIANCSDAIRIVGAQEAIDNLLDHPLIYQFAQVTTIFAAFLLARPGALSSKEATALTSSNASIPRRKTS